MHSIRAEAASYKRRFPHVTAKRPMRIIVDLQAAQNDSSFRGVGRYSKSLLRAMVPLAKAHGHDVWLLLNGNFSETIEPLMREFADVVPPERIAIFPGMAPVTETVAANEWRLRAAEHLREEFLAQLRPDVVHVSSLFEGSVDDAVVSVGRTGIKLPTVVTLYDLIPWVLSQHYVTTPEYERFYFGKVDSLRRADLLLAISQHSADEAVTLLQYPRDKVVNISAAIDDRFVCKTYLPQEAEEITSRYGIQKPFVLYMPGGFDPRKNFATLIDAYALLPTHIRASHQLVIGSNIKAAERAALAAEVKRTGLSSDDVRVIGYVPDEDLVALYSLCRLHVFPSLYEGFGLPVLEALACGAPTIASNTSSLPEVVGLDEALFDPRSAQDLANKMLHALADVEFAAKLRRNGLAQARRFSWQRSATLALEAIERTFRPRDYSPINYKDEHGFVDAVLAALSAHQPRVTPMRQDIDLLRDSAKKAWAELRRLGGGPVR